MPTERTKAFRALHHDDNQAFVLPTAWSAASALVFEKAGFRAVGTTSWGIAASSGYKDGEVLSWEEMRSSAEKILSRVSVMVSVDIEGGYSDDPEEIAERAVALARMGAVGINLEDRGRSTAGALRSLQSQAAILQAIKARLARSNLDLFVNARIDTYIVGKKAPQELLAETLERGQAYLSAGADGLFVPRATDPEHIGRICSTLRAPINLMVAPGLSDARALKKLGVSRLSLGKEPFAAVTGSLYAMATELHQGGDAQVFLKPPMPPIDLAEKKAPGPAPGRAVEERVVRDQGRAICVWDTGGAGRAVLFVHGNSASKNSFENQMGNPLLDRYRLVALDLPGHGRSDRVPDYGHEVYTSALRCVIQELGLKDVVLIGHSLGGNIAIESMDQIPQVRGVVAFGAAPLGKPPNVAEAFLPHPSAIAFFTEDLTEQDILNWSKTCFLTGFPTPEHFVKNIRATDPKVRSCLARDVQTLRYKDELACLSAIRGPKALWHGEHENTISLKYLKSLSLTGLWRGDVVVIEGSGHSPHIERPAEFNKLVDEFVRSTENA